MDTRKKIPYRIEDRAKFQDMIIDPLGIGHSPAGLVIIENGRHSCIIKTVPRRGKSKYSVSKTLISEMIKNNIISKK